MYSPSMRESSDFFKIIIRHVPTRRFTWFEGWVTTFSDNYSSQWNEEQVYGRMDPLATFVRTGRKIQLAFDVVSDDLGRAEENLAAVNELITYLYPVYEQQPNTGNKRVGQTIQAAPIIGLKWTNLIADASDNSDLIGYLDGVNYAPKVEEGGFGRAAGGNFIEGIVGAPAGATTEYRAQLAAAREGSKKLPISVPDGAATERTVRIGHVNKTNIYIPKTLSISLNFTVLHKHLPGWIRTEGADGNIVFGNKQTNGSFPNIQLGQRAGAAEVTYTTSVTNDEGKQEIVSEVTQIESAFGSELLK